MTTGVAWRPVSNIGASELKKWMLKHSKNAVTWYISVPVETLTGLRSWGGVQVTQGSGLKKNAQVSGFSQWSFIDD